MSAMLELSQPNACNSHTAKKKGKSKPKQIDTLKKMNCPFAMKMPEGIGDECDRHNQKKTECLSKLWTRRTDHANQNGADAEDGNGCTVQRNGKALGERLSSRRSAEIDKACNQRHRCGHQPEHHCSLESEHRDGSNFVIGSSFAA